MSMVLTNQEFQMLSALIQKECGIQVQDGKQYLIESRLASLAMQNGCGNFTDFYHKVCADFSNTLKEKIVDAMTTNETLWFRDDSPFKTLREKLFPECIEQFRNGNRQEYRIWSTACSTGQEPYSIAMTAWETARQQNYPELTGKLSLLASDISSSALALAKLGRYNALAMSRGLPPEYQEQYFQSPDGKVWQINENIRRMVQYQSFNLQLPFVAMGKFDVIFLRNVAIYFSTEFKIELFKKLAGCLKPGGHLFIGASESLNGYSQDFTLREHGRCMYYQLKEG